MNYNRFLGVSKGMHFNLGAELKETNLDSNFINIKLTLDSILNLMFLFVLSFQNRTLLNKLPTPNNNFIYFSNSCINYFIFYKLCNTLGSSSHNT